MKKMFLFAIPLSVCNLRCRYCYLSQRPSSFEGKIPEMRYSPEQVAYAMRQERVGGPSYFNLCADGETLALPDIDRYVGALAGGSLHRGSLKHDPHKAPRQSART